MTWITFKLQLNEDTGRRGCRIQNHGGILALSFVPFWLKALIAYKMKRRKHDILQLQNVFFLVFLVHTILQ